MRLLFVFVVLLNVLYAGWHFYMPRDKEVKTGHLPVGLKTLTLLHEEQVPSVATARVDAVTQDEEGENPVKPIESKSEVVESACYTLGPFRDKNIMEQLQSAIAELVTDISVRKRKESEKHRYWVYVPAQKNRKQAKLMAKKLREKNINDFYVVLGGESRNSISLGHFKNAKHANRRAEKVAKLGFKTEINVIYRDYDMYWLDYRVDAVNGESGLSVDEYASDGVSQLVRDCKS